MEKERGLRGGGGRKNSFGVCVCVPACALSYYITIVIVDIGTWYKHDRIASFYLHRFDWKSK